MTSHQTLMKMVYMNEDQIGNQCFQMLPRRRWAAEELAGIASSFRIVYLFIVLPCVNYPFGVTAELLGNDGAIEFTPKVFLQHGGKIDEVLPHPFKLKECPVGSGSVAKKSIARHQLERRPRGNLPNAKPQLFPPRSYTMQDYRALCRGT